MGAAMRSNSHAGAVTSSQCSGNGTSPAPHHRTGSYGDEPPTVDAAFHGIAGDIIQAIEPHTEADPVGLLVSLLAAVGNIVGSGPHWKVGTRAHYLRIFPVLVGTTSKSRKGTAWSAVKAVLDEAIGHQSDENPWTTRNVVTGLSSGEGLIWAVRDPISKHEPIKEKGRIIDYQDVIIDPGVDDKRLFVIEEEFASVLKVMGREGNTLSPLIRQAWDGGDLQSMTKNSPARATDPHITIYGHVTEAELRRYLTETEAANGFANRFLWVGVHRSKLLPDGGSPDMAVLQELGEDLSHVLESAKRIGCIERDDEAASLWREVYGSLSEGEPGLAGAITSRAEAQTMRLAAIYAVLDTSHVITAGHLNAALDLWEYCADSVRQIFGDAVGDPVADTILRALRSAGEMTRTEISALFSRNYPASRIEQALDLLESSGLASVEFEPTGGRPVEIWSSTM